MPAAQAHDYLKEFLGVESLEDVSKQQATLAIDELLKEVPDGAGQR
jgi:hypothetical protein